MKLDRKGNVDCQTKINIGVMIMEDGRPRSRGVIHFR